MVVNISSSDTMIISAVERKKVRKIPKASLMIDDLRMGEFVIHHLYGLGKFEGLTSVSILGGVRDFLSIKYAGEDKLLLPVENIDMIDRYIANSGTIPVVDKLGKGNFIKLKESVKKRLFEIAGEIVNMAAHRQMKRGTIIKCDDPRIKIFQQSAGFTYTEDQTQSINEIFTDLSSGLIMDRLLSGDVGFGKTEVALNGVYATVCSGYQALVIVPTTLLSSQHTKTFCERLEPLGVKVERLDRFSSAKEKKVVLQGMVDGAFDVVVGTHALLEAKMGNLGLVVIDEEHKFGVKQKEKLKALKADVHILSMSATPIPRSLNMALSKIKGYSQITTPPLARIGVRTFVKEYNESLLKEVILREIRRGGQLFYIHNRIASIEEKKRDLLSLIPQLRIAILHSDIDAATTEKILIEFTQGNYDLLLSTSIVESGIHIPKVNTILVDGADRFGLGDLHQLRGRVGRGNVEGYCYYLVNNREALTQEAIKRLAALESNSHLGSGAVLAFHDLEIRGGGNLVGDAQSGHIKNIGYSLYLRLLEEAIATVSGENSIEEKSVEIKLAVSAMISSDVVTEDRLRLELYRRFGQCRTLAEIYEIEEEIVDRFGALDGSTKNYIALMVMKILALSQGIKLLSSYGVNVTISYENGKSVSLVSPSKDDDDIISTTLAYLQEKRKQ
jgi:transcription-repair coupling factor (superfamily II helicase)